MPWIKSCLCHEEKKKTPEISLPIHLLKQEDGGLGNGGGGIQITPTLTPGHAFRCKTFKKPRPCHLCHQPIVNEGSCCRVCKYVCHKVCESREAAQRYTDTSWDIHRQYKNEIPATTAKVATCSDDLINGNVSGNDHDDSDTLINAQRPETHVTHEPVKNRAEAVLVHIHEETSKNDSSVNKMFGAASLNGFGEALTTQPKPSASIYNGAGMDLSYVTERIISVWFPSSASHSYRQAHRQVAHMLRNKHGNNYKVFNLTEPRSALRSQHKDLQEVGWAQNLAPSLEMLCNICKQLESWLGEDDRRIAVLHARGNKDHLGVIVAAYMHYSNICGSTEQALDRFSMRKFLDENIGPLRLPSNKRYVEYFSGLLSHNIKINAAPLYLTHVTVLGAPRIQNGGCRAFLKLYEGLTPVYTSGVYNVSNEVNQFTVNVSGENRRGLQLRGDILIKCYHRADIDARETVFACQFHTCVVNDYTLSFTRQELDVACNDPRFPSDGAVELHFSPSPEGRHPVPAPTPAVSFTFESDPITRADSPMGVDDVDDEDSDPEEDVNHTFGPLDGSIYATIAKKPELSPGAVSSPLTVSMDSGISSAGHQQNANTATSASPPLTSQPSPLTPEDQHRELDELLSDMMLTVQSIPDLQPQHQQTSNNSFNLDNVGFIDEEENKNIPYHARQDSRPFTYGLNSNTMIPDAKGLSSPSLVRKASVNKSTGNTLNKVQTQVYPEFGKPVPNFTHNTYNYSPSNSSTLSSYRSPVQHDPIDDIFTASALSANQPVRRDFREAFYKDETKRYDPLKSRRSPELMGDYRSDSESMLSSPGTFRTKSPEFQDPYPYKNLTWLQKQQLKLKERRDIQLREERHPHEIRLMSELKSVHQSRHMRPTASHRLDGYTSDTTAFADDDDDYTIPLHINTKSKTNERPFMAVKRAHERFAQNANASPASLLEANPMGHIIKTPSRSRDTPDSGLLSLVEQEQYIKRNLPPNTATYREESQQSWRSHSDVDSSPSSLASPRPQTPAFPVQARTPYANVSSSSQSQFEHTFERLPPKSPTTQRKDRPISPTELTNGSSDYGYNKQNSSPKSYARNGSISPTIYYGNSRRSSIHNEAPQEVSPVHVKFVRDTSRFWYKPAISREEAISMLRDQPPGTFVVRDSNSFPGAFGLALKVATVPTNLQSKSSPSQGDELIRHFLIEPTSHGVKIKGCPSEPVFSSLSALIYQHSVTPIALPCRLTLPQNDLKYQNRPSGNPAQQLLTQGAACNVLYLGSLDMESLTGPEAIRKAVNQVLNQRSAETAVVHFKVNGQGITLTDNKRILFFRRHYQIGTVSHCGLDPEERRWKVESENSVPASTNRVFGFIARKQNVSTPDNQCHLFAELEPEQPATAIVNFVNKILTSSGIQLNIV